MTGSYGFPPRAFPAGTVGPPAPWWLVAVMLVGAVVCIALQFCLTKRT